MINMGSFEKLLKQVLCLQIVVIITVMFAFVSMVAGIFGQNLHFSSTTTGTVSNLICHCLSMHSLGNLPRSCRTETDIASQQDTACMLHL